jgi:hypothetical protein
MLAGLLARLPRPPGNRWRWLAGVVGAGAVLAVAVTVLPSAHPAPRPGQASIVNIEPQVNGRSTPGGGFAVGVASGQYWQLAVQDIAGPGARCLPGVTINGTDADPLFGDPPRLTPVGNPAFTTLGYAMPGVGFAFVQVPGNVALMSLDSADIGGLSLSMQPVTVRECGQDFHLIGFAYPLTGTLRIH